MILGLPWTAWLLIFLSIVPALGLALRFYYRERRGGRIEQNDRN